MRTPALKASNRELYDLYLNNMVVTAKDIETIFGVGHGTAHRVINCGYEYVASKGEEIYSPPTKKMLPVDVLFDLYGWNINQIEAKVKKQIKLKGE